jgi:hypothetical protein
MNVRRNMLVLLTILWAVVPAGAQQVISAGSKGGVPGAASIPDFSGVWRHGSLPWLIPPASGPGPVMNTVRRDGVSDYGMLVGDYTNPILQPWAADVVKKKGEISRTGVAFPNPSNACWPHPGPFLFKHMSLQLLQQPHQIVMIFTDEIRHVRMNEPHPAKLEPSWYGDAVGRYEGDTLVVDSVGVRSDRPHAMVDLFGTPYTDKMHVVERYSLRDYQEVKDEMDRNIRENRRPAGPPDLNYKGKYLHIHFTIEDAGAYTMPWTATMLYTLDRSGWGENICAENRFSFHNNEEAAFPTASKLDF